VDVLLGDAAAIATGVTLLVTVPVAALAAEKLRASKVGWTVAVLAAVAVSLLAGVVTHAIAGS